MTLTAETNYHWAWALLDGLATSGVQRVVVSPGSRSTPLALAAMRHPELLVTMIVDERSAAFFALGLAKAEDRAVALIATSGSAVANWFPALVEADLARAPLILLSADRPPELQDCGANQTMEQINLFGGHVRAFHQLPPAEAETDWLAGLAARAVAASRAPLAGPVHINVPLREPLTSMALAPSRPKPAPRQLTGKLRLDAETLGVFEGLLRCNGAIVCGPRDFGADFHAAVTGLAQRLGAPILADVLSGLRFGENGGSEVLAHPDQVARHAPAFDWVLRFGGTPVCRPAVDWLERCRDACQIVVSDCARFADPQNVATHMISVEPAALCRDLNGAPAPADWLARFTDADRAAAVAAEAACAEDQPFEGGLIRRLVRALPADTPLFLGNSLAIRSAEWFAGRTSKPLRLFGNRGLSGIDGNLSTAFGVAAACGPSVAVVGDLAFLHDLNALSLGRASPLTVLLLDNGGGGIFDHLAQAALPEFEQGWLTPSALDPAAAARAFGLPYARAEGADAAVLAVTNSLARKSATIVHVPIDRGFSLARCQSFFAACISDQEPEP